MLRRAITRERGGELGRRSLVAGAVARRRRRASLTSARAARRST